MRIPASPVKRGSLALFFLMLAVLVSGMESFFVQTFSITHRMTLESFGSTVAVSLLLMDFLAPLAVALLSRKACLILMTGQTVMSSVILHYGSFFYNTLTISTMYHSMQGLSYLGDAVFIFVRPDILLLLALTWAVKAFFLWLSAVPDERMPGIWSMRGIVSLVCLMLLSVMIFWGHGKSGILSLWTDDGTIYRTAADRRSQEGTRESVRHLGYLATWMGEWIGGVYRDTGLIHAEKRCTDPQKLFLAQHPERADTWCGLPIPPATRHVVMVQVESLDFAALSMSFNGHGVMPFLQSLLPSSLLIRAFAPHKVGSANSDYEILNGREADQNVMYYSYIREYPDSVVHGLKDKRPAVFHGLEGNLFNLREAYALMGFDRTFFKEELGDAGYPVSALAMEHIADEYVLDAAAEYLEEGRGDAVFIVTMSSHIPFMKPLKKFGLRSGMFARYVSSLNYVDACLERFFSRLPDDTLFILWGDHSSDIPYPDGMKKNGTHVPFIVHVKEDASWLSGDTVGKDSRDTFTLCGLSYFLRLMTERSSGE